MAQQAYVSHVGIISFLQVRKPRPWSVSPVLKVTQPVGDGAGIHLLAVGSPNIMTPVTSSEKLSTGVKRRTLGPAVSWRRTEYCGVT